MKNKKTSNKNKKSVKISTYDQLKVYEGQFYKGMKVGGRHKWHYDKGEWKEKKLTPDIWQIDFSVKKRRAGKAPKGSGVAVGTSYQWAILANQEVTKLDANTYETKMSGFKCKISYKKADKEKWNSGVVARRRRLIKFLKGLLALLEKEELESTKLKISKKKEKK